jgi:hypothetical protein
MDYIALKYGEEIVCPEIFSHCFQTGDAIKMWYLGLDPDLRELYTTNPGCWKRFRSVMERRFTADISMLQLAAEDVPACPVRRMPSLQSRRSPSFGPHLPIRKRVR